MSTLSIGMANPNDVQKKRYIVQSKKMLFVLGIFLSVIGMVVVAIAANLQAPTEDIVIKGSKKSARFAHSLHIEIGLICGTCHHDANHEPLTRETISVMENSKPLRCNSCHNRDFPNPKLQTRKLTYHVRCKECHKKGYNDKNGPANCNGCHIKKSN